MRVFLNYVAVLLAFLSGIGLAISHGADGFITYVSIIMFILAIIFPCFSDFV